MLRVVEMFSGIGAQAKALERLKKENKLNYEILNTIEWDVNAIIAYDLIHNKEQNLNDYKNMTKEELIESLSYYSLSPDGKEPYKEGILKRNSLEMLQRLLCAIERSNNLVNITDIHAEDLPNNIDVLTYSFPCQNLSVASVVHGYMTGIDRNVKNRSGMLWEVERILKEMQQNKEQKLPKFLLMENVTTLNSPRFKPQFDEWKTFLKNLGYINIEYKLRADRFGIAQRRERLFMISIQVETNNEKNKKISLIKKYINAHNLQTNLEVISSMNLPSIKVADIICDNYEIEKYKLEADKTQLNNTPSRKSIVQNNDLITKTTNYVTEYSDCLKTITTKQDRHPTTGVLEYNNNIEGKLLYRYLTPRECFLGMGFAEEDYEILIKNNFKSFKNYDFFSPSKIEKMAGNSIAVNVLQAIFIQINDLYNLLNETD